MNISKTFLSVLSATILLSCAQEEKKPLLTIKNSLNVERSSETIELTKSILKVEDLSIIGIRDTKTGVLQITQTVDVNNDGEIDQLLFQPDVAAKDTNQYEVVTISDAEQPKSDLIAYSRFVPERTDDYTWENDKVAFRVYGPTAQKMIEDEIPGGTLSSGVDAWLKKVEYPIINKWYKEFVEGTSSYHEDTGEGLDNFHVGVSRGVGGIAVKMNDTYHFSKNYTEWRTITTGPIRTQFYLNYADWSADGKIIRESKIITLDKGSNLTKFDISLEGIDQISAGLTLHEKDGEVTGNNQNGWVSYWQPHANTELGTAIVAAPNNFLGFEKYDTDQKDLSNAYAHLAVNKNQVVYYAGFAWSESGQFKNKKEWESYLTAYSEKLKNPLEVSYN